MQPTPAFSPGKSHGQRSLAGYSPWVLQSQTQLSNQKQQNKVLYIYIFNSFLFYFTCVVLDNLKMKLKNGILIQYNIVYLFYYCYHNYYYCIYPLLQNYRELLVQVIRHQLDQYLPTFILYLLVKKLSPQTNNFLDFK